MNQLLKSLGSPRAESKGAYQLMDWNAIRESVAQHAEDSKQELREEMGELRDELVRKIDESSEELRQSLYDFSRETSDLKLSIESLHTIKRKDAKEWSDMIANLQKKIDSTHSEGKTGITESEKRIKEELKESLKSLQSSIRNVDEESVNRISSHSKIHENEIGKIYGKFKTLEEVIGKIPKDIYEFGAQLQVSNAGSLVAITSAINFKSGFTVIANGLNVDVSVAEGGVGAWTALAVDGVSTTFSVSKKPTDVNSDGTIFITGGIGYTYNSGANTITFVNPPQQFAAYR